MSLNEVERMSVTRYSRHLDQFLDFLDYQDEAIERAKRGEDDEEVN